LDPPPGTPKIRGTSARSRPSTISSATVGTERIGYAPASRASTGSIRSSAFFRFASALA
jgi:hypothetical protein